MWVGEFFGVLTALCWSLGIFPFTESTHYFSANTINTFRLMLGTVMLALIVMISGALNLSELFTLPAWQHWLWLGASGLVGLSLGDYFSFAAFKSIGARNSSIFSTLAPGAAIIFGYFFLNEKLNATGIAGMLITMAGISLIALLKKQGAQVNDNKHPITFYGSVMAIMAALCQGAGLVLARKAVSADTVIISPFHAAWIRICVAALGLYVFAALNGSLFKIHKEVLYKPNKGLGFIFLGTFLGSVLGISFAMKTVSLVDAAVAQTIFSLVPVFAIPLSYAFYRQKITTGIVLAAALALLGVVVLIWRFEIQNFLVSL